MLRSLVAITALLFAGSAFGKAEGIDSRKYFPPIGCGGADGGPDNECHLEPASETLMVTIDGPTQIEPGSEGFGIYTVSIPVGFGAPKLVGAGMNVAIAPPNSAGCMLEEGSPPSTMAERNESFDPTDPVLSHDYSGEPPPSTLVGVWSYQFLVLNCQNPGPLLLLAAMNAFDGTGTEEFEVWNKTQLDVTVPEPSAALLGATALAAVATLRRSRA
jgi:hypothetical protein